MRRAHEPTDGIPPTAQGLGAGVTEFPFSVWMAYLSHTMLVPAVSLIRTSLVRPGLALGLTVALVFSLGCDKPADNTTKTTAPTAATSVAPPATAAVTAAASAPSPASGAKAYQSRGVVKAFGEGRKTVKISHEDIPGYMKAMTMPFAVSAPSVLEGMKEGDAVEFSFTEESDGRLLLQSIKKR